jgi:hypothetical protein
MIYDLAAHELLHIRSTKMLKDIRVLRSMHLLLGACELQAALQSTLHALGGLETTWWSYIVIQQDNTVARD